MVRTTRGRKPQLHPFAVLGMLPLPLWSFALPASADFAEIDSTWIDRFTEMETKTSC